jgi:hypothetical protein
MLFPPVLSMHPPISVYTMIISPGEFVKAIREVGPRPDLGI